MGHTLPVRRFTCPTELFGEEKWVERKRFIKAKDVRGMQNLGQGEETKLYQFMANNIVAWNLDDPDTGEPLPQPRDDSSVFDELDILEQLPWLITTLFGTQPPFVPQK